MERGRLPLQQGKNYYEIRLESIGGLGANLCGKMLGELAVNYLGLNSTSFSSYGSEKTGTPVKAYIRYCESDREIRAHSPVVAPDLLVVFHQALLQDPKVWEGCSRKTKVLLALSGEWKGPDGGHGAESLWAVNAQQIAMESHSRINVVMLGAMAKVMGFVSLLDARHICEDALGRKYPDALAGNLEGVRRGYEEVRRLDIGDGTSRTESVRPAKEEGQAWGYAAAPIGGVNPCFGSTVVSDLSPSRQGYIPVFIKERCINCGMCDSTCPDMVFQFAEGEYQGRKMMVNRGLDYYHCKGCLRCVDVCPVNALVQGVESEHPEKSDFLPNQELLRKPDYYLKAGTDGYITSESYLTEKRMEGGEV